MLWSSVESPQKLHQAFCLGIENTYQLAKGLFAGKDVMKTVMQIVGM